MKFFILAAFALSLSAQAKIEILTIGGSVSGRILKDGTWTVYASQNRLGEECKTETEYVTCDACIGAKVDDSCSTRYVRSDSYVIFIFSSSADGAIKVTNGSDLELPFRLLGEEDSKIKRVAVKWADLADHLSTKTSGSMRIYVGTDFLPVNVRMGNIPQFSQKGCDEGNAHGICDFDIDRVGDTRLISIMTNGLESRDSTFEFAGFRIFAMPVATAEQCVSTAPACTSANGPGSMSFDVRVASNITYDDKFLMDFSQGQKYCLRVANIDVAKNLSSATSTCLLVE